MNQVRFTRTARSNERQKIAVFCRNYLVQNFGEGKIYLAALHKIPTQTVDSSQVLAKYIRQKQPQIIKIITENWDKNTIKDLKQVFPKQDHHLLSTF